MSALRPLLALFILILLTGCGGKTDSIRREADAAFARSDWAGAKFGYRKLIEAAPKDAELRYRLGVAYARTGQPGPAYEQFRAAAAVAGDREDVLTELADLLLNSYWRDVRKPRAVHDELLRTAETLEKNSPRLYAAQRVFGYLALVDRQPGEAVRRFRAALEARPGDSDATAMLAQALFDSGLKEAAEETLLGQLERNPADALAGDVLIRFYEREGRSIDVEALLRKQASAQPAASTPLVRLARHRLRSGDEAGARRTILDLESSQTIPDRHYAAGEFWEQAGRVADALRAYEAGAATDSSRALLYRRRQVLLLIAGRRFDEARAIIDRTLAGVPDDSELLRARALILSESAGRTEEAQTILRKLAERTPPDGRVLLDLGRLLNQTGDLETAEQTLKRALDSQGADQRTVLLVLASNAMLRGAFDEALRYHDGLLEADPGNLAATLGRVSALSGLGRLAEARTILNELRAGGNVAPPILDLESGFLLLREGKPEAAEPLFRRLFKPGLPNVRVVAGLAESLSAQGKDEETVRLLNADLTATPGRQPVLYALAESLGRKGEFEKAAAVYRDLLVKRPDPSLYERLATLWLRGRRMDEAAKVLAEGRRRFPSSGKLVAGQAQVADLRGDFDQARRLYREWIGLEPGNPIPLNNLAYLLADHGVDIDEAFRMATDAVRRDSRNPGFQDTLAFVHLRRGQPAEALRILEALVRRLPDNPAYRFRYGVALRASGMGDRARAEWKESLRRGAEGRLKQSVEEALTGK